MIYWYTGQPGHGKTLTAIARALEFKEKGRHVFVCNVRDFDYEKTGMSKMTPADFIDWMNFLPDGAVCLVDEAYEHGMLPKRPPSGKVPPHVERLATHRHRGIDFIFVCQSPDKQIDVFVHDLIEEQVHVRRRFGTSFQHLRIFDRFERNPEKATPLRLVRQRLPKHVFGLYKSTELDTTERRIPWYFIGFAVGVPLGLGFMYYTYGGLAERLGGGHQAVPTTSAALAANGAQAPVAAQRETRTPVTPLEYAQRFVPRLPAQPWSAPAYDDKLHVSAEAPRLFCMASGVGKNSVGNVELKSCSCITEQGTRYKLEYQYCVKIAQDGQYEPFREERDQEHMDGYALGDAHAQALRVQQEQAAVQLNAPQVPSYGQFGIKPNSGATNPGWGTGG